MEFQLDRASPVPLHHQIAQALRLALAEGELKAGQRLPPLRSLAAQLGVNLHTVGQAYAELAAEGLLCSAPGRGTCVVRAPEREGAVPGMVASIGGRRAAEAAAAESAVTPPSAGSAAGERPCLRATLIAPLEPSSAHDRLVRVRLARVGERLIALPLVRDLGLHVSLVRADGLAHLPPSGHASDAGEEVMVELLEPPEALEETILAAGSHDLVIDILAGHLQRLRPGLTFSYSDLGSRGGLLALKKGEAHLAGCHLLDPDTGEYNLPFVRRLLPEKRVVVVNLVYRQQGLMVPRGNPRGIRGLEDLARPELLFVNRQPGSGTRTLLDHRLRLLGLEAASIRGYEREEASHLAVAAAVASGAADVGLGILAAARALDLDFMPLARERYDLVIPWEHYQSSLLEPLLGALGSDALRAEVRSLGGYDTSLMGEVVGVLGPRGARSKRTLAS